MIQLTFKKLGALEQAILDDLQNKINVNQTFAEKVAHAQSLWNSKGGNRGEVAFTVIREELRKICVFTGVCNYCEQSEANDIEHIYPKSFFPEYTFDWNNYILACKQCNSGHKLDKGFVLDTNDELVELVRTHQPPHSAIAFINIRIEDPNSYMILNPKTYKFEIFTDLSKADFKKAWATREILELNTRDTLLAGRRSAENYYYNILERLIRILKSTNSDELEHALSPLDNLFDLNEPLDKLKDEILISYRKHISTYLHPSVWYTIKIVKSKTEKKWESIFKQLPQALNW